MIVVNFATPNYSRGQHRLQASLNGHKSLMIDSYESIGSPTHAQSPYQFKIHAIESALNLDDIVLWMDASMYVVGDLSRIEQTIINDGHFMEEAGHWVGSWTNKHTRQYFNLNEEEARVPGGYFMFSAGLLGLNKQNERAMEFLKQWKASALAGCFRGEWTDHRHDMSAGSIIAQRLGMKYQRGGSTLSYVGPGYSKPEDGSLVYCQGLA
jgi:hypothetical protein